MGDSKEGEQRNFPADSIVNKVSVWEYEPHFSEYAFLIGRKGKDALEIIGNYPTRIKLNTLWHGVLNSMRNETATDKKERFSIIGYKETSRDL